MENTRADALSRRPDHVRTSVEASPPLLREKPDGSLRHTPQPLADDPILPFTEVYTIFKEKRIDDGYAAWTPDPNDPAETWEEGVTLQQNGESRYEAWYQGKRYI